MSYFDSTITLTFGDQAENHVGMQKIGQLAPSGFNLDDLLQAKANCESCGLTCELINLNNYLVNQPKLILILNGQPFNNSKSIPTLKDNVKSVTPAHVLIVRNAVNHILNSFGYNADSLFYEQMSLNTDKQALMRGRVVNKRARYNLCFGPISQEPDYEKGKGRIIAYSQIPLLNIVREILPAILGEKAGNLVIEGNYYYDITKCGIGFHGDSERRKVVAIRLGCSLPLHYHWYCQGQPIGRRCKLILNHGDMYIMSEKATGFDWRKRIYPTLRHAAGCEKYLRINGSLN